MLSVTGGAALTVGQSAQFTALSSAGQSVTNGAVWQTSDTTVARVSTLGVVLAVGKGSVNISATFQGVRGAVDVLVSASLITSPTITTCGDIVAPGAYTVANDMSLPVSIGSCVNIRASGVTLDCADHAVSGVHVFGGAYIAVQHCTLPTFAWVEKAARVTFHHNHLATITLQGGHDNAVRDNTIDGGYDGSGVVMGEDDGVIVIDEANDTIVNNTIRNVWDAGVEGVDAVTNTLIANNTIDNTGSVGISSYWCTAWRGNTVSGNSITRSPGLVGFIYGVSAAKCADTSTVGVFLNNLFVANRYRQPTVAQQSGGPMNFSLSSLGNERVMNNLIQDNDMGASPGPAPLPPAGFIDGGGNTCAPNTSAFCGGLPLLSWSRPWTLH